MKKFIFFNFFLTLQCIAFSQYIDSAKLNLITSPATLELHGIKDISWQVSRIELSVSDTIFVALYTVACPSFGDIVAFDTIITDPSLPTIPLEIVVYTIQDTNTTTFPNCGVNSVIDTLYTYSSFQSNVGLQENKNPTTITVYPNPATDQLQISGIEEKEVLSISLLDLSGRIIREFPKGKLSLNLVGIEKGKYIVHLETDHYMYNISVFIE